MWRWSLCGRDEGGSSASSRCQFSHPRRFAQAPIELGLTRMRKGLSAGGGAWCLGKSMVMVSGWARVVPTSAAVGGAKLWQSEWSPALLRQVALSRLGQKGSKCWRQQEDLFESQGRGLFVVVQQGCIVGGETAQRKSPKVKRGTTSPVGEPVLSSGRKASGVSNGRTKRRSGAIRKGGLNRIRIAQH
jgi:hypothetical protein